MVGSLYTANPAKSVSTWNNNGIQTWGTGSGPSTNLGGFSSNNPNFEAGRKSLHSTIGNIYKKSSGVGSLYEGD